MKFDRAVDRFITDQQQAGRINSRNSELAYRQVLGWHGEDVGNRDPAKTGRDDVRKTLARWSHARTRKQRLAILRSFYDWCVEEGLRPASPARQVRSIRVKPTDKQRLTRSEIVALLDAAEGKRRDRWAVNLMLYAGLRNTELRELRARDLNRDGWIRVHGKGNKQRWVPVVPELERIVTEIRSLVLPDALVLPGRVTADPPRNSVQVDTDHVLSSSALRRQMVRLGERAGIALHVHPHLLRHAYGDAVTRYAGARVAQTAMGHTSIETTVGTYAGAMSLDELAASMTGFGFRNPGVPTVTTPDETEV